MAGDVLVGYDATGPSRRALVWAAAEAGRRGATLTVLTVVDRGLLSGFPPGGMAGRWRAARERGRHRAAAGAALASVVAPTVRVDAVADVGSPRELLVSASRRADLTVLGHGTCPGARPGSVVEAVARHGKGPVVIVGARGICGPRPDSPVGVGVDGSVEASAALDFAASSAAAAGVPLRVICVAGGRLGVQGGQGSSLAAAARIAEEAAERSRCAFPQLRLTRFALEGEVADVLVRSAAGSSLLVVGRRGAGRPRSLLLGSVISALLRAAPSSLAVVGEPLRTPDVPTIPSVRLPASHVEVAAG
jgi:nucleotide-binding universal stress UspA family protein